MIKSSQGSSNRIVLAVLGSLIMILLVLYIRQTNQYSSMLRLHHRTQTSLQEKTAETIRQSNEIKVKDSQCATELEALDKEIAECDGNSKTISKELQEAKQSKEDLAAKSGEFESALNNEKEKYSQMEGMLRAEAEQCAERESKVKHQLDECLESRKVDSFVKKSPQLLEKKLNDSSPEFIKKQQNLEQNKDK